MLFFISFFIFALKGNHREQRCSVDGKPCNFRTVVVFCMTVIKSSAGSVTRRTWVWVNWEIGDRKGTLDIGLQTADRGVAGRNQLLTQLATHQFK